MKNVAFGLFAVAFATLSFASPNRSTLNDITASATSDAVRITAGVDVAAVRVQTFAGDILVYDSEWRGGNLIDWRLDDAFGHTISAGAYRLLVSTRDMDGRVTTRNATAKQ